jgi:hypothetical protein
MARKPTGKPSITEETAPAEFVTPEGNDETMSDEEMQILEALFEDSAEGELTPVPTQDFELNFDPNMSAATRAEIDAGRAQLARLAAERSQE